MDDLFAKMKVLLELNQGRNKTIGQLRKEIYETDREMRVLIADHLNDKSRTTSAPMTLSSWQLELGAMWDCPESPTKHCVYNHTDDACHDHCLFCGDPEERK